MKHIQIAEKVGKSREYVSNTLRILDLPEEILTALSEGKISEGHTRPLLMLADRKEEQLVLFKEILFRKLTVREAEALARNVAKDRVRKKSLIDPALAELEQKFKDQLGTKVYIEKRENGGKISIDFFNEADILAILERLSGKVIVAPQNTSAQQISEATPLDVAMDDRAPADIVVEENTEDLYSIKNFGV
jgi:ParB family chromosome partitioning protein